jgi:hypothetical protein
MEDFSNIIIKNFNAIAGGILTIVFGGYVTWRISQKNRRYEAIEKFMQVFIDEREKIKRFNIQDYFTQERTIFDIRRYLNFWQSFRINRMWRKFKQTEEKYRQAIRTQDSPPNTLIHYGDHKANILSKIDKIINYLK